MEGVFSAHVRNKTIKRLKLRVIKGQTTLTYDLRSDGGIEVFPLQLGDGRYEIVLYENVSSNKYSKNGTVYLFIKLEDETAPFLHANQYVNFSQESDLVAEAKELCFNKSQKAAYESVCKYIKDHFVYDFIKASIVKASVLPDVEKTFSMRMGICQDLAALTVAMLRSQGIPSRLMIGYADSQYHAWVSTWIDGKELLFDPMIEVNGFGKVKKYTVERFY